MNLATAIVVAAVVSAAATEAVVAAVDSLTTVTRHRQRSATVARHCRWSPTVTCHRNHSHTKSPLCKWVNWTPITFQILNLDT